MITAVLKQHIRKRERKLLPVAYPKTDVKHTKKLPGIRKMVLNRYILSAVLLIFCTLVLLSFKVVPDRANAQLILPADTLYEEAVFNYILGCCHLCCCRYYRSFHYCAFNKLSTTGFAFK